MFTFKPNDPFLKTMKQVVYNRKTGKKRKLVAYFFQVPVPSWPLT